MADRRVLRLIRKWLKAGVMEDEQWQASKEGSPQGATVSPLLANLYLHYVFDVWVQQWRRRYARGNLIVVRYADDVVVGFEEVISRSGHAHLRCEYTMHHAYLQFHRSRYLECYQTARQGMQLALEIGDAYHHISCQIFATFALLHRGEWGEMQRLASEGLKTSDANGLLFGSKFFRLHLAWLHLQAFAFEPARRLAEVGLEQARQTPYDNFATFFGLLLLGMAHLGLGQSARTRDYLDEIKQRAEAKPLALDWLLQMPLYQLQGDY
ncbi:MAG: reverse transcriptase domain-containing protein [Chromatiales bacterium]